MALGVTVDFNANLAKFSGQMDKMAGNLDKFQQKAESMSSKVNSTFAAMGVGISAAGLVSFVKSGIDAADALSKLADKTGITVENLSGLKLAAELSDTSLETVAKAVNKLSINIAKSGDEFKALGVSAKDPLDAFLEFADVFSSIDDAQQRAAFGNAALGKSYADLAPLLMQGAQAIRDQVAESREYNKVTTEQALQSAAFNDELTRLEARVSTLSITVAGPLVTSLNEAGNAFEYAMRKADGFHPLDFLTDYANGSNAADQLGRINLQIEETKNQIDSLRTQGPGGALVDALLGTNSEDLDNKLIKLQSIKAELTKSTSTDTGIKKTSAEVEAFDASLKKLIGSTDQAASSAVKHSSAVKSTGSAINHHAEAVAKIIEQLQFEISITGESLDAQRQLTDIRSATAQATGTEAAAIESLIKTKYALIEADQILADGERLAAQQRSDSASEYDRLNQKFNGSLLDINQNIGDALDARAQGIIPDDAKLKEQLDKIGSDYNQLGEQSKQVTDGMSEYAVQAARNMQSAFADYLFDPFDKSASSMLDSFLTTIRKMAAEAASAQIMDALLSSAGGKSGSGQNESQALVGLIGGLVSSAVGSYSGGGGGAIGGSAAFANGGIMTSLGPLQLNKYSKGGIANSPQIALFSEGRQNEAYVPLPDGRSIPVSMKDGGSKTVINNINFNISTPNADSFRKSERQIKEQMRRAVNV